MKTTMRRTVAAAIGTAALATLAVLGPAETAFAASTTYDCFAGCTGGYTSKNVTGGYGAAVTTYNGKWDLRWNTDGSVTVDANLEDLARDGKGPTLVVKLAPDGISQTSTLELRDTDGFGEVHRTGTIKKPLYGSRSTYAIEVYVCNGKSSSGANQDCSAEHGPFHP